MTDTEIKAWLAEHVGVIPDPCKHMGSPEGGPCVCSSGKRWLLREACPCIRYGPAGMCINCLNFSIRPGMHSQDCTHCPTYAQPENGLGDVVRALGLYYSIDSTSAGDIVRIIKSGLGPVAGAVTAEEDKTGDEAIRLALYRALTS